MQGFILTAIAAAEECTLILDLTITMQGFILTANTAEKK